MRKKIVEFSALRVQHYILINNFSSFFCNIFAFSSFKSFTFRFSRKIRIFSRNRFKQKITKNTKIFGVFLERQNTKKYEILPNFVFAKNAKFSQNDLPFSLETFMLTDAEKTRHKAFSKMYVTLPIILCADSLAILGVVIEDVNYFNLTSNYFSLMWNWCRALRWMCLRQITGRLLAR